MNVLIYGAGNSIAISLARYLHNTGHNAILADTRRYVRGFYSKYCNRKYMFTDPCRDKQGFASTLQKCIIKENVHLILPTYDDALFHLIGAKEFVPEHVKLMFPMDNEKIRYVMDKKNIPSICARSCIDVIPTYTISSNFNISDIEGIVPPYVLKLKYGVSGEGFKRIDTLLELKEKVNKIRRKGMEDKYLLQKYVKGVVYGAIGVFEDNALKYFLSYRYVRRFPHAAGNPTICTFDYQDEIREAMSKVLAAVKWEGFCQMDFIVDDKTHVLYLADINPVHWYSMPNSISKKLSCLNYYLGNGDRVGNKVHHTYATICITREIQRIVTGGFFKGNRDGDYWHFLRDIRLSDLYWDPMPMVLAPLLRLMRGRSGYRIRHQPRHSEEDIFDRRQRR